MADKIPTLAVNDEVILEIRRGPRPIVLRASVAKVQSNGVLFRLFGSERDPGDLPFKTAVLVKIAAKTGQYAADTHLAEAHVLGSRNLSVVAPLVFSAAQRRIQPRVLVRVPFTLLHRSPSASKLTAAVAHEFTTVDLSWGGLQFHANIALSPGENVRISLRLPHVAPLEFEAVISWARAAAADGKSLRACGVQFLAVTEKARRQLIEFLASVTRNP